MENVQQISSQINGAFQTLISLVQSIVNPIAILAVIIVGIYLIAGGTDSTTIQKAKKWLIVLAIGVLLVNFSGVLVSFVQGIQPTAG